MNTFCGLCFLVADPRHAALMVFLGPCFLQRRVPSWVLAGVKVTGCPPTPCPSSPVHPELPGHFIWAQKGVKLGTQYLLWTTKANQHISWSNRNPEVFCKFLRLDDIPSVCCFLGELTPGFTDYLLWEQGPALGWGWQQATGTLLSQAGHGDDTQLACRRGHGGGIGYNTYMWQKFR